MSAATADINTNERQGQVVNYPIAAATLILTGIMVAVDASGNLNPATDTAGLTVVGRSEQHTDNTAGAAGALQTTAKRGVFGFLNDSSGNAITAADVGVTIACVLDNQTVTRAAGTTHSIKAGLVVDFNASQGIVWVDTTRHTL
jgi:hypothetical protein